MNMQIILGKYKYAGLLGEYPKVPVEHAKVLVEFVRILDIFMNLQEYIQIV